MKEFTDNLFLNSPSLIQEQNLKLLKLKDMKTLLRSLIIVLSIQYANAQTFNPQLATMLQDTFDTYVSMIPSIKGMSASVYVPGQGTWKDVSGVSYAGQPITLDMEFGIASNTKVFVSTAMLMLAEDGIISLDDSLHEWLPVYPNINSNITIRQLLNHTSGISDPIFVSPWMDTIMAHPSRVFTPVEVLGWVGAPQFPAGTSFGYSNINYILAGMIAEIATGYHISKIIRDSILTPLDMDSTFYDVEEAEVGVISHRWWNSVDFNDTSRVGINTAAGCAGALFSTSSEMAQWYHALFSGQFLNQSSMTELTTFLPTSNPTYDYGLGLSRETTQGYTYWGHGGDTWGYKSKMIYDTCTGTAVCGLSNSFPSGLSAVVFMLYRVVANHLPGCSGGIAGTTIVCQGQNSITYTIPPIPRATSYIWTLPSGVTGTSNTNSITVDFGIAAASGNISVKGTNMYGDGATSDLAITINALPPTPVITLNGNVIHSDAPAGNQWFNQSGIINGATNQDYACTADGDYYVIVTLLGCSSDTSNIEHIILTGFETVENNTAFNVYPVPVSDELTIENVGNSKLLNFEILNAFGQKVFNGNFVNKTVIQTDNFAPGVYIIRFENGKTSEFKKIIKE